MEELEKEVALLREKLQLLEKIKGLENPQPQIVFVPQPYPVPVYPYVWPYQVYPPYQPIYTEITPVSAPWETSTITWGSTSGSTMFLQ